MRGWSKALAWIVAPVLVAAALSGCSIVDNFSSRAVDFNMQAEQVQEQALLLNVVRASLRRPMQFTGLQSITGTASISGNSTLTVPFGPPGHRPRNALSPDILGFSGTVSGGPSFVVPVLDTQEFYEGILSPISLQVFDYYLQQGFPKEVLFDLFVSKVVLTQKTADNCIETSFNNSVGDDAEFDQFQAIVDMLFAAGLSTEHVENTSTVGPPISAKALEPTGKDTDGTQMAALIHAYADASTAGLKFVRGQGEQKDTYRLQKTQTSYRFCFADPGPAARPLLGNMESSLFCNHSRDRADANADEPRSAGAVGCVIASRDAAGKATVTTTSSTTATGSPDGGGSATVNVSVSNNLVTTLDRRLTAAAAKAGSAQYAQHVSARQVLPGAVSVTMQIRSTEGILYYLGEVTRRHLYPDSSLDGRARVIQVPTRVPAGSMPQTACADEAGDGKPVRRTDVVYLNGAEGGSAKDTYYCENLFVVDGGTSNGFITINYDGHGYELADDKDRGGRTYQVLELAKQLFSLNTSAKQLPASSTIVISQP